MIMAGQASAADIFTLQTTLGGDGGVNLLPGGGFDVYGSNNGTPAPFGGPIASLTSYTATAGVAQTLAFDWTYTTQDTSGAQYDPVGYILNGVQFQLSPASSDPISYIGESGHLVLNLAANDTYGFYVYSTDSEQGRADILVKPSRGLGTSFPAAAVPEPAAWALMLSGFFGVGAVLRRRRAMAAAA
jgi:hypothetical protein